MVVRRLRARGGSGGGCDDTDRHRQAQRHRSARLARRRARSHRRHPARPAAGIAAMALEVPEPEGWLIMAAISYVFTIKRAAQMLGRDEDLLWHLLEQLEPEDGMLWVYDVDGEV